MKKKTFFCLLAVVVVLFSVFPVMSFYIRESFEGKMNIRVQSRLDVHFTPVFELRDIRLKWEDKVSVLSGDLTVRYDPFTLMDPKGLHLLVSSGNLKFQLEGDWARQLGQNKPVLLDELYLDIRFNQQGISEITSVNIQSPELRFSIGQSINKAARSEQLDED